MEPIVLPRDNEVFTSRYSAAKADLRSASVDGFRGVLVIGSPPFHRAWRVSQPLNVDPARMRHRSAYGCRGPHGGPGTQAHALSSAQGRGVLPVSMRQPLAVTSRRAVDDVKRLAVGLFSLSRVPRWSFCSCCFTPYDGCCKRRFHLFAVLGEHPTRAATSRSDRVGSLASAVRMRAPVFTSPACCSLLVDASRASCSPGSPCPLPVLRTLAPASTTFGRSLARVRAGSACRSPCSWVICVTVVLTSVTVVVIWVTVSTSCSICCISWLIASVVTSSGFVSAVFAVFVSRPCSCSTSRNQPLRKMSTSTSAERSQVRPIRLIPSWAAALAMLAFALLFMIAMIDCIWMETELIPAAIRKASAISLPLRPRPLSER